MLNLLSTFFNMVWSDHVTSLLSPRKSEANRVIFTYKTSFHPPSSIYWGKLDKLWGRVKNLDGFCQNLGSNFDSSCCLKYVPWHIES